MSRRKTIEQKRSNTRSSDHYSCASDLRVEAEKLNEGTRTGQPFMSGPLRSIKTLRVAQHDLSTEDVDLLFESDLQIDTETDGLDFRRDRLRLVTIEDLNGNVVMVRNPDHKSTLLNEFLTDNHLKVFHHAPFDVSFIYWWTGARLREDSVLCTKIICKLLRPKESSALYKVIPEVLGVNPYKEKSTTLSNWNNKKLTAEQITYACTDVHFLADIVAKLQVKGSKESKTRDYKNTCIAATLSAFVNVEGNSDCLSYEGQPNLKLRQLWEKRKRVMRP